ncbi:scarecrow-like protein 32 [Dorcoceras hygrometricum]|uniref:Scarecrow-like protein 32 n=1 Tax=Dorcoceras hygrometricum TaxID=472368 RepID=A0A2Z7D510_9LAMI|nr:scarecrow-like protein 32 [Dorcoceras hygrometricum]
MKAELQAGNTSSVSLQNPNLFATTSQSSAISGALKGCLSSIDGACIEKLLLHCASALERNDVTLAQQVMWVLNNVASSTGDPNQRLASYFLKALISKASRVYPTSINFDDSTGRDDSFQRRSMSVTELARYVDLIPWYRFGFCASNGAILKAVQGCSRVHVLDFSITHCMQWPTLIDALSKLTEGVPTLRISVLSWRPRVPPTLNAPVQEIGQRLTNFAKIKDVPFEFNVIELTGLPDESSSDHLHYDLLITQMVNDLSTLKLRDDDEVLVVNCQNWLRFLPDDQKLGNSAEIPSCRDCFLDMIQSLDPCIVTVVDEDCDIGASSGLASRITTCFNYLWIPFDALETFLPKHSPQRIDYEADFGQKIEHVIGFDGVKRTEIFESSSRLSQRMIKNGFSSVAFSEETVKDIKLLLDEHASGWGMKKDGDMLLLTWKGHNSVYASTWVPQRLAELELWENSLLH